MKTQIQGVDSKCIKGNITISGSKSESNRLLILKQLYPELRLVNLSDSDDTHHLQSALNHPSGVVDIGHAGTAMRFLTAYFASQEGIDVTVTGSERMQQRPIQLLVDALRDLGADIQYLEKEGYPPLHIKGKQFTNQRVSIQGNISSQYISALLLIAPSLPNGLVLDLMGAITSRPYIEMTLKLLESIGVQTRFRAQTIEIAPLKRCDAKEIVIESDWSSASYFYSCVALGIVGSRVRLSSFHPHSLQGDKRLATIYEHFGVSTSFEDNAIVLTKHKNASSENVFLDLTDAPDIAQTIAVTCFGLGISCDLHGLHTLRIKETNRLEALENELRTLGADIRVTVDSLHLRASNEIHQYCSIQTYNDHRMAMAFAPLGICTPITILDATVVTKSYPNFWNDLQQVGFQLSDL